MVKSEPHYPQEGPIDLESQQPYQSHYRWVILALVWLLYFACVLVTRSMAPLITPILEDLNISYSQMGVILGAWSLVYIAVSIASGALIDRWGIYKCILAGILIVGLSEILRYFAGGFISMFLFVAIFGLGGTMITIGSPKSAAVWFRGKERGTAVAIYMTGARIGGLAAYSLTNSIVMPFTNYSWRFTFVVYGLVVFVVALMWLFLGRDVRPVENVKAEERAGMIEVFRGLISIRNVRLVLIMGFLSLAVGHALNDWLPNILETGGLPPVVAGYAASIPVLVGMPLSLLALRMIPPHLRRHIAALGGLVFAVALMIIATTSGVPLVIGLVLYGVANVFGMPFLILILMDVPEVGSKYMGSAGGMFFCIAHIGGFAGPVMMGTITDLSGSFLTGMIVLAGLSLVMAVMALFLKIKPAPNVKTSP